MKKFNVSVHAHYAGAQLKTLKLKVNESASIIGIHRYARTKLDEAPDRLTIVMIEEIKNVK